jgi:hypothetical protein
MAGDQAALDGTLIDVEGGARPWIDLQEVPASVAVDQEVGAGEATQGGALAHGQGGGAQLGGERRGQACRNGGAAIAVGMGEPSQGRPLFAEAQQLDSFR